MQVLLLHMMQRDRAATRVLPMHGWCMPRNQTDCTAAQLIENTMRGTAQPITRAKTFKLPLPLLHAGATSARDAVQCTATRVLPMHG